MNYIAKKMQTEVEQTVPKHYIDDNCNHKFTANNIH